MQVTFYGACREVTGSNILVESGGKKILLECGFFQGSKLAEEHNYSPFPYNPTAVDAVIVGHAHLDHTGRLPKLVKEGFGGRVWSTGPTQELTQLVLEDTAKIMAEEKGVTPLYNKEDIEATMELFECLPYEERVEIAPSLVLAFKNAGHILGSCITVLEAEGKKLVYTSDLGNNPSQLLDPPVKVESANYAICESTYGGRTHEQASRRAQKLAGIINTTVAQNGVLLIPTFAIERTQELLHDIEHFCVINQCRKPSFFLDSPLAQKVTRVFAKYPEYLSQKIRQFHQGADFFGIERLKITTTREESEAIHSQPNPKVIIAGSGMMNGGRILFHAQKYLSDPTNTLLIVGYQPLGSLGRRLIEGERQVKILGHLVTVKSKIESIRSYSAHADLPQLLEWLGGIGNCQKIFIVHGETDQSLTLAKELKKTSNCDIFIPQQKESYEL